MKQLPEQRRQRQTISYSNVFGFTLQELRDLWPKGYTVNIEGRSDKEAIVAWARGRKDVRIKRDTGKGWEVQTVRAGEMNGIVYYDKRRAHPVHIYVTWRK